MITILTLEQLKDMKQPAVNAAASELQLKLRPEAPPLKRCAAMPDAVKRYLKLAQEYAQLHPKAVEPPATPVKKGVGKPKKEDGSRPRDPGSLFFRKRFKLIYDPEHPRKVVAKEKVKGEEVAITQGEAIHRFERMGRLILDRWAGALAAGEAAQIMTGREIIDMLEKGRAKHFPSCRASLYRAFQNYMTVFGLRSERTPKGLGLVEKLDPLEEGEEEAA